MSEQHPDGSIAQLLQLCAGLDEYTPVVPDQLVHHVLRTTGYNCTDSAMLRYVSTTGHDLTTTVVHDNHRLLATAGQHFLVQVCADALQLHKRRKVW